MSTGSGPWTAENAAFLKKLVERGTSRDDVYSIIKRYFGGSAEDVDEQMKRMGLTFSSSGYRGDDVGPWSKQNAAFLKKLVDQGLSREDVYSLVKQQFGGSKKDVDAQMERMGLSFPEEPSDAEDESEPEEADETKTEKRPRARLKTRRRKRKSGVVGSTFGALTRLALGVGGKSLAKSLSMSGRTPSGMISGVVKYSALNAVGLKPSISEVTRRPPQARRPRSVQSDQQSSSSVEPQQVEAIRVSVAGIEGLVKTMADGLSGIKRGAAAGSAMHGSSDPSGSSDGGWLKKLLGGLLGLGTFKRMLRGAKLGLGALGRGVRTGARVALKGLRIAGTAGLKGARWAGRGGLAALRWATPYALRFGPAAILAGVTEWRRRKFLEEIGKRAEERKRTEEASPEDYEPSTLLDVLTGKQTIGGYLNGAKKKKTDKGLREQSDKRSEAKPRATPTSMSGSSDEIRLDELVFDANEIVFEAKELERRAPNGLATGSGSYGSSNGFVAASYGGSGPRAAVGATPYGGSSPGRDYYAPPPRDAGGSAPSMEMPSIAGGSAGEIGGGDVAAPSFSSPSIGSSQLSGSPSSGSSGYDSGPTTGGSERPPPLGKSSALDESGAHGYQRGDVHVRPWLVEASRFAAEKGLPEGYHARVISTVDARSTGTPWHPSGRAIDFQIYDSNNKRVPYIGSPGVPGYGVYERMALAARQYQEKYYPKEKFVWGGHFNSGVPYDRMHFQSGGVSARNFSSEQLASPVVSPDDMDKYHANYGKPVTDTAGQAPIQPQGSPAQPSAPQPPGSPRADRSGGSGVSSEAFLSGVTTSRSAAEASLAASSAATSAANETSLRTVTRTVVIDSSSSQPQRGVPTTPRARRSPGSDSSTADELSSAADIGSSASITSR